jgi:hypothetical protein
MLADLIAFKEPVWRLWRYSRLVDMFLPSPEGVLRNLKSGKHVHFFKN